MYMYMYIYIYIHTHIYIYILKWPFQNRWQHSNHKLEKFFKEKRKGALPGRKKTENRMRSKLTICKKHALVAVFVLPSFNKVYLREHSYRLGGSRLRDDRPSLKCKRLAQVQNILRNSASRFKAECKLGLGWPWEKLESNGHSRINMCSQAYIL